MPHEYGWPEDMDRALQHIEQLTVAETGDWLQAQYQREQPDRAIHLLLALASARYVDHHGPFIGHGTFNGGPMLRAALSLSAPFRRLALLHTACYVVDLLHQPNYGPYVLLSMDPVAAPAREESRARLLASIASGEEALMAEHRLVGLLAIDEPPSVRSLLTEAALQQFHENEHRLLIVHRAAQLMDDSQGWTWAEPLLRPAVQYLATRPDRRSPVLQGRWRHTSPANVSAAGVMSAVEELIAAPYGEEPALLLQHQHQPLTELIALTSSDLLRRSTFDAHGVTGIHCILDLLHDREVPTSLQELACEAALLGQRTRRQKAQRAAWRPVADPPPRALTTAELHHIIATRGGEEAMNAVGGALRAGTRADEITRLLMECALTTSGPFEAIHNVKMVWGLWLETQRSRCPDLAWRHLAAGARVVADTAQQDGDNAAPVLTIWHRSGLSH